MKKTLFFIALVLSCCTAFSQTDTLIVHENSIELLNRKYFTQIEDPYKQLKITDIFKRKDFSPSHTDLPSLKMTNPVMWLKLVVKNKTIEPNVPFTVGNIVIDSFEIFFVNKKNGEIIHLEPEQSSGAINLSPKETLIDLPLQPDSSRTIYIRIQSNSPNVVPIEVYSDSTYWESYKLQNTGFGIFIGIMAVMLFYNLILYFIVKDKSYIYYVCYVGLLTISQSLVHGYRLYITNPSVLNDYVITTVRVLLWLSITLFVNEFLQLKKQYHGVYRYYRFLIYLSLLPLPFIITGHASIAYSIISFNSTVTSVCLLILGIWLYSAGVKHAKFFMFAWTSFLFSTLISTAKNKDVLQYNFFTANVVLFGVAVELVLFSVALADKINLYRDQNNETQSLALQIAKENEKLITEQNIQLENKVLERTKELLESNKNLMGLISNLKAAQSQLVETEKMASLGQLTAGIAHEINNPINFVKSNIKPLKMDFRDIFELLDIYTGLEAENSSAELLKPATELKQKIDIEFIKTEVTELLNGIEDGASRTAEIVQSLRAFSRTDEVELKTADINKGILNSLVLLRNTIPYYIEITPVFDKMALINCYPGKLNQVFMNLIHNSIQAIVEKKKHEKESILIATRDQEDTISIEITDTGIGMTEEVKQKMFDPFFTTKDVGEGTGLGLSIVFGIIEKHKGSINVESKRGKGTTIVITLPKNLN